MKKSIRRCHDEAGQTTVLLVGVIAIVVMLVVGLSAMGQALVGRAHARTAADAVALAAASDERLGVELVDWYRINGVAVEMTGSMAHASGGPSQAAAWAELGGQGDPTAAPVLVAIVARIGQLTGSEITPTSWARDSFVVSPSDAAAVAMVAPEFGVCADSDPGQAGSGLVRYRLCD